MNCPLGDVEAVTVRVEGVYCHQPIIVEQFGKIRKMLKHPVWFRDGVVQSVWQSKVRVVSCKLEKCQFKGFTLQVERKICFQKGYLLIVSIVAEPGAKGGKTVIEWLSQLVRHVVRQEDGRHGHIEHRLNKLRQSRRRSRLGSLVPQVLIVQLVRVLLSRAIKGSSGKRAMCEIILAIHGNPAQGEVF